jgi:predicted phosphodiesterase
LAASIAGGYVALRAFGGGVERFALGSVLVELEPARQGTIDVYVPIVDWGVRAHPFEAPLVIKLRFRSLDRDAARRTLRSGEEARATLARLRREVAQVVRRGLVRSAALAVVGGTVGGLLAGGLVGAARRDRRWILYGATIGALSQAALAGGTALDVRNVDYEAFDRPTFYAQGRELPRLLSFSEQLLRTDERYTESYEQALAGLANLVAFASAPATAPTETQVALVASDLHSNTLVLSVLREYASGKPIFFVGDFTLLGTRHERSLATSVARLGSPVVAVSGNHDSAPFMQAMARAGAIVLTRDGRLRGDGSRDGRRVVEVGGLSVAGYDDPLEGQDESIAGRPLELHDEALADAASAFVAWFESLEDSPDVVLVHQHALAHALLDSLPDDGGQPLLILTGHDHKQHLEQRGAALLVDGGTVGAGGPLAIGEQSVGFIELRFTSDRLQAVDLIEVDPLSGEARAERRVPQLLRAQSSR